MSMTPIKLGEKVVEWTWEINHCAQLLVTNTAGSPNRVNGEIQSNGTFECECQLGQFTIGQLTLGSGVISYWDPPIPNFPFKFDFTLPGSYTVVERTFSLAPGTYVQPTLGTVTITAVCDIMYELVDDGVHGWAVGGLANSTAYGPLFDTPNDSHAKVYLQLNDNATYQMVTNTATYNGTMLLTDGVILDNRLWSRAVVTAKSTSVQASGSVTLSNNLGAYISEDGATPSWSNGGATASGSVSSGVVSATCTGAGSFEIVANMGCTYNMERVAYLGVTLTNQAGTGLNADVGILRYDDDAEPTLKSTVAGYYGETISQHSDIWTWTATHNGNSAPAPNTGGWNNWGNIGVALDTDWSESEQQDLPADWGATGSPYLSHRDGTVPFHTFWNGDVIDITQEAAHALRIGYNGGQYSEASNILTATGNAVDGSQVGTWSVSAGATVELDNTNDRILVKPASGTPCVATRTLTFDAGQCGTSPTKPPRDAWTGYRWLTIGLEPADPETGAEIISVGDSITVDITQDNLASLTGIYPDPDTQTWTGTTNATKRYLAVTQRAGSDTYIDIDLANPVTPSLPFAGENPPVTGNYGDDVTARPNVLSHWPQPTMDAPNGGVTNAKAIAITLPGDTWWNIGEFTLHHKAGAVPVFSLMPGYNQWIRGERKDEANTEDLTEAKTWRRRLFTSQCEGLLGVELFDIERSTHLDTETALHVFGFTAHDVETVLTQLTNVQQFGSVGAIRTFPGWGYTVTIPDAGTYPVLHDIADHLMGVGCYMGGRGIIWNGEAAMVCANMAVNSYHPVLQGLTNQIDWFGGCGDVFNVASGSSTGALYALACTVLRGSVEGLGKNGNIYDLTEDTRPTVTTSTVVNDGVAGTYGDLRLVGGHPKLDHHVRKDGATAGPNFDDAHTIVWTVQTGESSSQTVTECPSWWEHRGIYRVQYTQRDGALHPRYRPSDKKPLCQKRGLGRTLEGRCVRCPHGA